MAKSMEPRIDRSDALRCCVLVQRKIDSSGSVASTDLFVRQPVLPSSPKAGDDGCTPRVRVSGRARASVRAFVLSIPPAASGSESHCADAWCCKT